MVARQQTKQLYIYWAGAAGRVLVVLAWLGLSGCAQKAAPVAPAIAQKSSLQQRIDALNHAPLPPAAKADAIRRLQAAYGNTATR